MGDATVTLAPLEGIPSEADSERPDSEVSETPVYLCSTCDEPFVPNYYKHCHECGFDFGHGIEPSAGQSLPESLPDRAIAVVIGLVTISMALIGYFAWVLK